MAKQKNDQEKEGRKYLALLSLSALGVVYGDIGTSPLYALRVCFHGDHALAPDPANVLGVLSLIFWSLILVISIKYLLLILRADNHGEGGILALMELVLPDRGRSRAAILVMGLFGAALLYGDRSSILTLYRSHWSFFSSSSSSRARAPGMSDYCSAP